MKFSLFLFNKMKQREETPKELKLFENRSKND